MHSVLSINIFLLLLDYSTANDENKVCNTFYDYLWQNTSNVCYYSPDLQKRMPELVWQHNYPAEGFEVTTEDGYILKVFRMEQKNRTPKGVVLLFHGATASCDAWVDKGNVSLALSLYDDGYEVWITNSRGTSYSRKHVFFKPDIDQLFWDFSFHEMGLYDIPAQIDFIKEISKADKISYVGHSMGGTAGVVYASLLSEHAKQNINAFILLGPAVYFNYTSAINKVTAKYGDEIYLLATLFRQHEIFSPTPFMHHLTNFCSTNVIGMVLCSAYIQYEMGINFEELYTPFMAQLFSHNPDGISIKVPAHYYQMIRSNKFRAFDHGSKRNLVMYASKVPPDYPIENISVPIHLMAGAFDRVVNYKDLENLFIQLSKISDKHELEILPFNHIDFLYGKDIDPFLNRKVKDTLLKYKFYKE